MDSLLDKVLAKMFMRAFWYRQRWQRFLGTCCRIKRIFDYCYLRFHGVETEPGHVTLKGLPIIRRAAGSRIVLERDVTLVSRSEDNIAGINHPVILATLAEGVVLRIGEGSGLSGATLCAASGITVGKRCGFGANASAYDTDFHPLDPICRRNQTSILDARRCAIEIGDDVWIGANALILKGTVLGDAAIVGAGAIVSGKVEAYTVVAGNPARFVKSIRAESV